MVADTGKPASIKVTHHKGAVGWGFMICLATEFRRAREQRWNEYLSMVFMGVILRTTAMARKAHKISCRITQCLDLWEIRQYADHFSDTVADS